MQVTKNYGKANKNKAVYGAGGIINWTATVYFIMEIHKKTKKYHYMI